MPNLFSVFKELIPSSPLLVGTVSDSYGDTHRVTMLGGGTMMVRGKATLGESVFIRGDLIQGTAPNLPTVSVEI